MATPAWQLALQPASFRGVPFGVEDSDTVFGRRNAFHEYPKRDTNYAEDMGRKARTYTFNAFIIGDNYITARDALIAAIENQKTPGILIHPTLGMRTVKPGECRVMFKNTEGGIEYFSLTFTDAGINQYPSSTLSTQSNSQNTAASSNNAVQNSFAANFNVSGLAPYVSKSALSALVGGNLSSGNLIPVANSLAGVLGQVLQIGAVSTSSLPVYSNFQALLTAFNANASSLLIDPQSLAENISNLISGLVSIYPSNPRAALLALIKLFNMFGSSLPPILLSTLTNPNATPNKIQQALNQEILILLVQVLALIEMVSVVSQIDFTSQQDAQAIQASVTSLMKPTLLTLGNNAYTAEYGALNTANIAMILDIKARSATLQTIVYISLNQSIPALVLAYKQYGDATQAGDIIARNKIANPSFLPAMTQLEVLT